MNTRFVYLRGSQKWGRGHRPSSQETVVTFSNIGFIGKDHACVENIQFPDKKPLVGISTERSESKEKQKIFSDIGAYSNIWLITWCNHATRMWLSQKNGGWGQKVSVHRTRSSQVNFVQQNRHKHCNTSSGTNYLYGHNMRRKSNRKSIYVTKLYLFYYLFSFAFGTEVGQVKMVFFLNY